ncbi:MAG: hypothetical protein ACYDH9_08150 [Limisphaerales bacterium]
MTADQREHFRNTLLVILDANQTRFGLPVSALVIHTRSRGNAVAVEQIDEELQYLKDKGFVELVVKVISPELRSWRITASGRDYLAEKGL